MKEKKVIPWWHIPKDEWDAMPDVLKVRGFRFIKFVTKELLEDNRLFCEMWERMQKDFYKRSHG